ncbi:hypothetical protein Tco_1504117 [Tanacetum coccineum]
MKKTPHDDQDPLEYYEGKKKHKNQKHVGESSSGKEQVMLAMSKEMDWVNPETNINKDQELFKDYTKPLPMVGPQLNRKIPICHFFNKDLEYLMHGNKEKKTGYLSLARVTKRLLQDRKASIIRGDVHSNSEIVTVKHIKVERKYDYGFLTRTDVIRADGETYTFKEFDYRRLSLYDIEDFYVLKVQGKLHHLLGQVEYDLVNSLLVFIIKEVIKKRVENIQLGVESYQLKLNLTKPKFTFLVLVV